jgi:uncharacterized protein YegJ (DUF2314 family)
MKLDLTRTKAALAIYDAKLPKLDAMLEAAQTDTEVNTYQLAVSSAEELVRIAFFLDTKDRNRISHCLVADLSWLRELVARHNP